MTVGVYMVVITCYSGESGFSSDLISTTFWLTILTSSVFLSTIAETTKFSSGLWGDDITRMVCTLFSDVFVVAETTCVSFVTVFDSVN